VGNSEDFEEGGAMTEAHPLTVVCLASYEKGHDFLRACHRQGCQVILITRDKLSPGGWPRDSIAEFFTMPDLADRQAVINAVSYLARTRQIDRIVPLDDYDVETAAALREHLRVPGMGDTTARYFRDKLAMRVQAREKGILVPDFVPVLNYDQIRAFMEQVPPPWMLKPRSEAATVGIHKVSHAEEFWRLLDGLGDRQSYYVLERFVFGHVYHVDAIVSEREVVWAEAHQYHTPPMRVTHEGGIFVSRTLPRETADVQTLQALMRELISALGFVRGVTHTEFIKGHEDGRFYFLETAARVGGAHIADMVEAATGVNLWAEWSNIEIAGSTQPYVLPPYRQDYAGIIISLARQEYPDTSAYNDPEIVWRLNQENHAGLIIASPDSARIEALLDSYISRFYADFHASAPPRTERPS
jgi:biotin carboxylase